MILPCKIIPESQSLILHLTTVQNLLPVLLQTLEVLPKLMLDVIFVLQEAALKLIACDFSDLELFGFILVEETIDVPSDFDLLRIVVFPANGSCTLQLLNEGLNIQHLHSFLLHLYRNHPAL